ncbi:unnamed protein product [Auanema sp. JU1783]|nr:unnamed protein product [Auanema sp. JU1783]
MDLKKRDDEVVRLVRKYVNEHENDFEEEPKEPFPQDCCGQSCKPCVFDIHHDDVVRWAKEYAKQIKYDDSTLYQYLFDDCPASDESKEWFLSEFRSLEIIEKKSLNNNTVLVKLRTPKPLLIPIASHIRIRCANLQVYIL